MKSAIISTILFFLCVLAFMPAGSHAQPHDHSNQPQAPAAQNHPDSSTVNKATTDPADTTDTVTSDQSSEAPSIPFSMEKRQFTGVVTKKAESRHMSKRIRSVGRIELNEKAMITVNTKFEGWIEKLNVNFTGKMVKKGDVLAEIYSPELYSTQQEYLSIRNWLKGYNSGDAADTMIRRDSEALLSAARKRLALWDIPADQIDMIEKTGTPLRTVRIISPASGYIQSKPAVQGMRMMPGEKLFDIADISTLWIIAEIYENDLPFIRTDQKALINLSYFPGRPIESVVDYIYPDLSQETRTVRVRLSVSNTDNSLKPGMFTNIEITADLGRKLVIPDEAVIDTGLRKLVYVEKDEESFEPREVTAGISAEGLTEILSGIKEGDRVAASGNFLIDSEAQLKGYIPSDRH